eukprot:TRINITY_DN10990_c0_g1_i4.p1 TRINITY_DN10990_c0_g1~~TRINITY_DN10990_c0_g1_i4.p1  ORF type:complete len:282 (-),score=38.05 TRINITY_DN10990_c0_g1_i4:338-1183(-)
MEDLSVDRLLRAHDDVGNPFDIHRAVSYCAEDEYTRLARDIVVISTNNNFLVKRWGGGGHRAQALFGNAFGTFFYRPPKTIPATENDIKFAVPLWEMETKGWLLTFTIDGLGPKNRELESMFGQQQKEAMLSTAEASKARCYVMPSSGQSSKSSIAAPMTALVSYLKVDEISLDGFPDFMWSSMEQALDPTFNVHAGVIANYCLETSMASWELLTNCGWTESELPVVIELPEHLSTLHDWGTDISLIYTSAKKLVLGSRHARTPLPCRLISSDGRQQACAC